MSDRIWIAWEDQRRNRELSKAVSAKLFEFKEIAEIKNPLWRYLNGIIITLKTLLREKPRIVFGMNPSLILSLFLVCIKKLLFFKVIIDAHNAGLFPAEGNSKLLMGVSRFIQRHADVVVVTNEGLHQHIIENRGRGFVLQDKFPEIPLAVELRQLRGRINFLFICSFAADEPYGAVIEAAARLPEDICIYITGNYKKVNLVASAMPPNVELTGFVPVQEFENLLNSVDATIDLTARENCLVCGAYESVSVGKPMILSDTKALRDYFYSGAVYTNHTVSEIQNAIIELVDNKDELTSQVKRLGKERSISWELQRQSFENFLVEVAS